MLRLEELRHAKRLTKIEMGKVIGKTAQAYGMYETGKREMNVATMTTLAEFFNVTVGFLLGLEGEPEKSPVPIKKEKPLLPKEKELLDLFRRMDDGKQERLIGIAIGYAGVSMSDVEVEDFCSEESNLG